MKISELVQTEGWKKFMAKLYAWGASVVLAGALFKIQHYPGASLMLVIGMSTEVVIFFFSGFEPLHEELDWTLVYPELAGIEGGDEEPQTRRVEQGQSEQQQLDMSGLKKLDTMLQSVEVNSDLFETLGEGLNHLNQTTNNLSDLTDAAIAADQFADQVRTAGESAGSLTETFQNSKEDLNQSIEGLTESYRATAELIQQSGNETAEKFSQSGNDLLNTYNELADSIKNGANTISGESQSFSSKIGEVNKNLSALNSIYELQYQETKTHIKNSQEVFKGFENMMKNLKEAADSTQNYRDNVNKLSDNIAELNSVYGNMLSSLNLIS